MFWFKKFNVSTIRACAVLVTLHFLTFQLSYAQGIITGPRFTCPGVTQYYTSTVNGVWSVTGGTMVPSGIAKTIGVIWDTNAPEWMIEFGYSPDRESEPVEIFVYVARAQAGQAVVQILQSTCIAQSGTLKLFNNTGPVVRWESSLDKQNWTPINHTGTTYTFPGVTQNTYFRAVTNGGSCGLYYSSPDYVRYTPIPAKPSVTSARTCAGTPVTLTATGEGYSYQWYEEDGITPIPAAWNATYSPPTSRTSNFYVAARSYEGCESEKAVATLTVDQLPGAPPEPGLTKECDRTIVTMKVPPPGHDYIWSFGQPTPTSGTSRTFTVETSQLVAATTLDKNTGCYSYLYRPTIVNVEVIHKPEPPLAPSLAEQCRKTILTAQAPPDNIAYFWQTTPEGTLTNPSLSYTAVASGTYYLRAARTNLTNCWSPAIGVPVVVKEKLSCLDGQQLNYVVTNNILKEGVKTTADVDGLSALHNMSMVAYADGFGRVVQEVSVQASPSKHDIVHTMVYDNLGRITKKYLPYSGSDDGRYDGNTMANLTTFYSAGHASSGRYAATNSPWSETIYEASPLNRITEQGAPGEAWQIGKNTAKVNTTVNQANEVRLWNYHLTTGQCSSPGYYAPGALVAAETTDENGYKTWTYQDKDQKTVLVKKQLTATEHTLTYYVYDGLSRLRMIIQPEGVKELALSGSWTADAAFISKWCFTTQYDRFGRVTEKKVPGAAVVYFVYNARNQVILSQDGNQRSAYQWSFTKYDALNRTVMTGVYTHPSMISQTEMQTLADAHAGQFEKRTGDNYAAQYGYTTTESFPPVAAAAGNIYVVNYYDDYNFDLNNATADPAYVASGMNPEPVVSMQTVNKVTGVRVALPGTGKTLLSVSFYDKNGNIVQEQQDNHLGGKDIKTRLYDFAGKVLASRHFHQTTGATITIDKRYEYDHTGRVMTEKQRINNGPEITLAGYQYNELGQQVEKKLHSENGSTYLQKIDLRYNIRGWLSRINDRTLSEPTDLFGMELSYNEPGALSSVQAQHNGNITEAVFNDRITNMQRGYGFSYDKLNRLTIARYNARDNNGLGIHAGYYDEAGISYDLNGNLRTLKRNHGGQASHDLTYAYSGNRLATISNAAAASPEEQPDRDQPRPDDEESFTPSIAAAGPTLGYHYDANGNLIRDQHKGISLITYNHLNLAERIVLQDKGEIHYRYDATGTRLSKTVIDSTGIASTRYYAAGFEYNNSRQLVQFLTPEGRVIMNTGTTEYQYFLKDHLGNVRVTFTATPRTETASATFEPSDDPQKQFLFADEAVKVNHALFDHTNGKTTRYAARLNGKAGERIGPAKTLSVMTGDTIDVEVFAKYVDTDRNNWNTALINLMTSLANATAPAGTVVDGGAPGSIGNYPFAIGTLIDKTDGTSGGPKAYLNYLVFDRRHNLKTGGFVRLSENAKETGTNVAHERLHRKLAITEPGFVYIYLSNENDTPVDVYFDDFTVTHTQSMVVQSNDYYPFGATFNSFTRENSVKQSYLFNGKEKQSDLCLNWDDFGARMYDPEIGRWNGVDPLAEKYLPLSPYAFVDNNPAKFIDKDGKEIWIYLFVDFGPKGETNLHGKVMYKDGQLYTDSEGKHLYTGNNDFAITVRDQLNQLRKDHKILANRIDVLTNSKKIHTIEADWKSYIIDYDNEMDRSVGLPTGSRIGLNAKDYTVEDMEATPRESVAHELLSHAYEADQGLTHMGDTPNGGRWREVNGISIENLVRAKENLPLRGFHTVPLAEYRLTAEQIVEQEKQRRLDKLRCCEYIPFEVTPWP